MISKKEEEQIEKRLEKVESRLLEISKKVFDGFGESIINLVTDIKDLKKLLGKLLITVFGFGCIGIIVSLIFKFLERK